MFCDIDPRHAQHRPGCGGRRGGRAHDRPPAGAHLRLPRRHARLRAPRVRPGPVDRRGCLRGARSAATPTGRPSGAARIRRHSASTRTSSWRRARAAPSRVPTLASRSGSTASATRAGRPTWAGSTTTGSASTTACLTSPARLGSRSSSASTTCSPPGRGSPRATTSCSAGSRASTCRARTAAATRRSWFVYVVQLPDQLDRDQTVRDLRERGVDSKPYLPAIHLLSFYRERFGHREGEFPVCEDGRAPLAGTAVLPRAHRRPDRTRRGCRARGHRPRRPAVGLSLRTS